MLERLSLVVLLISLGILFHNAGTVKDETFGPLLNLRNGFFSLWQLFLNDELDSGVFMNLYSDNGLIGYAIHLLNIWSLICCSYASCL